MTGGEASLALIKYDCDRCGRGFVEPRVTGGSRFSPWVLRTAVGRVFAHREPFDVALERARREARSQAGDEAFHIFVQSVSFCSVCREFVCRECWEPSRRTCRICASWAATHVADPVVAAPSPAAPLMGLAIARPVVSVLAERPVRARRQGPSRRATRAGSFSPLVAQLAVVGLLIAIAIGGGYGAVTYFNGLGYQTVAGETGMPAISETASPSPALLVPAGSANPFAGASLASPTGDASPSPWPIAAPRHTPAAQSAPRHTPSPTRKPTPNPTPTPTPTVTPLDPAHISCVAAAGPAPYQVSCDIDSGSYLGTDVMTWLLDDVPAGSVATFTTDIEDDSVHTVQLMVGRTGTASVSSNTVSGSTDNWS